MGAVWAQDYLSNHPKLHLHILCIVSTKWLQTSGTGLLGSYQINSIYTNQAIGTAKDLLACCHFNCSELIVLIRGQLISITSAFKGLNKILGGWSVTGILVLEILVPRTKIFTGKYGPPLEKSVRVEDAHFRPSFFSNKRIKSDSKSTKVSLGNSQCTWRILKQNEAVVVASRVSHAIILIKAHHPLFA